MMNNQPINQKPDANTQLKNVFEQSLAILNDTQPTMKSRHAPRPLPSFVPLHIDDASLQKRALDDAAKALATLWKVPSLRRT